MLEGTVEMIYTLGKLVTLTVDNSFSLILLGLFLYVVYSILKGGWKVLKALFNGEKKK